HRYEDLCRLAVELRTARGKVERARHDSDDGVWMSIQENVASDDGLILSIQSGPQAMTEDGHVRSFTVILRCERPPQSGRYTEYRKQFGRYSRTPQSFRLSDSRKLI